MRPGEVVLTQSQDVLMLAAEPGEPEQYVHIDTDWRVCDNDEGFEDDEMFDLLEYVSRKLSYRLNHDKRVRFDKEGAVQVDVVLHWFGGKSTRNCCSEQCNREDEANQGSKLT